MRREYKHRPRGARLRRVGKSKGTPKGSFHEETGTETACMVKVLSDAKNIDRCMGPQ